MQGQIVDWQPRVIRHSADSTYEYAIHEVYFGASGEVITYTLDALSPRKASVEELKESLIGLLLQDLDEVKLGDLEYSYSRETVEEWLQNIEHPPLDYETLSSPQDR